MPADLSGPSPGDNPVVVTVTDEAGNSSSCMITVTIVQGDCPETPQEVFGACCNNEVCSFVTADVCMADGGTFFAGAECEGTNCTDCDPNELGLNLLMSIIFQAPVCGMGCPLMIFGTFGGLMLFKSGRRVVRRRRDVK